MALGGDVGTGTRYDLRRRVTIDEWVAAFERKRDENHAAAEQKRAGPGGRVPSPRRLVDEEVFTRLEGAR